MRPDAMEPALQNPAQPLVFVSHSSRDKVVADAICARLEQHGIRCWIAPRDIDPGRDYSNQIVEALEKSSVMVMVFSSGSNSSRHVKSEIDRAFGLGRIIVPFRVENVEPEKGLAYYLSKTHWLDAVTPPLAQHIDHLAVTIRKLAGEESAQPAATRAGAPTTAPPAPGSKFAIIGLGVAAVVAVLGTLALLLFMPRSVKPGASAIGSSASSPSAVATPANTAPASLATAPFEGRWKITNAKNFDGKPYTGTVQIIGAGDQYALTWQTGGAGYSGIGLARGNMLCAGWSGNLYGVGVYKIGQDGTLDGTWVSPNQGQGIEKASGGTPGKIEGRYMVVGRNPGAENRYTGELEITQTGDTYQLRWKVESSEVTGVAIRIADNLCVAWGDKDQTVGLIVYTFDGDHARGVWTLRGGSQTGTENSIPLVARSLPFALP